MASSSLEQELVGAIVVHDDLAGAEAFRTPNENGPVVLVQPCPLPGLDERRRAFSAEEVVVWSAGRAGLVELHGPLGVESPGTSFVGRRPAFMNLPCRTSALPPELLP